MQKEKSPISLGGCSAREMLASICTEADWAVLQRRAAQSPSMGGVGFFVVSLNSGPWFLQQRRAEYLRWILQKEPEVGEPPRRGTLLMSRIRIPTPKVPEWHGALGSQTPGGASEGTPRSRATSKSLEPRVRTSGRSSCLRRCQLSSSSRTAKNEVHNELLQEVPGSGAPLRRLCRAHPAPCDAAE